MKRIMFFKLTQAGTPILVHITHVSFVSPDPKGGARIRMHDDWISVDQSYNQVEAIMLGSMCEVYGPAPESDAPRPEPEAPQLQTRELK